MNSVLQSVQAVEGVRKVCREEGEQFDIAGVHLTWKVKAHDSAYSFSVMEATLAPGEGVPVHSHPSVESFYVLSGDADFFRVTGGEEDWIRCEAGELMILPPNSLHGLYNHGSSDCRLLGISTAVHQTFFDAVADADRASSFASMTRNRPWGKLLRSQARTRCISLQSMSAKPSLRKTNGSLSSQIFTRSTVVNVYQHIPGSDSVRRIWRG
jgi:quercetin dioxygenase-like cupin family protein